MITGFNTDIKHLGIVYHVQTEDRGLQNPRVETLVYRGGEIISTQRTSYNDVVSVECLEEVVTKIMEEQHQRVIKSIKEGRYDTATKDSPAELLQRRSLDQVILDYLSAEGKDL